MVSQECSVARPKQKFVRSNKQGYQRKLVLAYAFVLDQKALLTMMYKLTNSDNAPVYFGKNLNSIVITQGTPLNFMFQ
jgi:hypothetical protein